MTREEAAAALNNSQYGNEGSLELFAVMKAEGLVAVYGASDDLVEFRGAIHDEIGAYGGDIAYLTRDGLLTSDCDDEDCPYFEKLKVKASAIEAIWDDGEFSWSYETGIPHSTFIVVEDDEPYCRGIVFALSDIP